MGKGHGACVMPQLWGGRRCCHAPLPTPNCSLVCGELGWDAIWTPRYPEEDLLQLFVQAGRLLELKWSTPTCQLLPGLGVCSLAANTGSVFAGASPACALPFPAKASGFFSQSQYLRKDLGGECALFSSFLRDLDMSAPSFQHSPPCEHPCHVKICPVGFSSNAPQFPDRAGGPPVWVWGAVGLRGIAVAGPASPGPQSQLAQGADGEVEPGAQPGFRLR